MRAPDLGSTCLESPQTQTLSRLQREYPHLPDASKMPKKAIHEETSKYMFYIKASW